MASRRRRKNQSYMAIRRLFPPMMDDKILSRIDLLPPLGNWRKERLDRVFAYRVLSGKTKQINRLVKSTINSIYHYQISPDDPQI